jgi:hypothetical protein
LFEAKVVRGKTAMASTFQSPKPTAPLALASASGSCRLHCALLWVQGAYYLLTGVWPLVSLETFLLVTGPKTDHLITGDPSDHWLVITVGVLVTAIALALLAAAWRRNPTLEVMVLAIASAAGLTIVDFVYVYRQAIGPIYLVDAALEIVLLAGWGIAVVMRQSGTILRSR